MATQQLQALEQERASRIEAPFIAEMSNLFAQIRAELVRSPDFYRSFSFIGLFEIFCGLGVDNLVQDITLFWNLCIVAPGLFLLCLPWCPLLFLLLYFRYYEFLSFICLLALMAIEAETPFGISFSTSHINFLLCTLLFANFTFAM